jgi:hypothetical protein
METISLKSNRQSPGAACGSFSEKHDDSLLQPMSTVLAAAI